MATIIDVRSKIEFLMGHPNGAKNIPLGVIPKSIQELKEIESEIVLCCASGNRSGQAVSYLQNCGFKNVHNAGAWQNAEAYCETLSKK